MKKKKELKEHVMISLTPTEKQDLRDIAQRTLGSENMSQMVRYWITKYKIDEVLTRHLYDKSVTVSSYFGRGDRHCEEISDNKDAIQIGEMKMTKEDYDSMIKSPVSCADCKKEPATHGIGEAKTICGKCWNEII